MIPHLDYNVSSTFICINLIFFWDILLGIDSVSSTSPLSSVNAPTNQSNSSEMGVNRDASGIPHQIHRPAGVYEKWRDFSLASCEFDTEDDRMNSGSKNFVDI